MEKREDKFKSWSTKNKVWFVIGTLLAVGGFSLIVLDTVARNLNIAPSANILLKASHELGTFLGSQRLGFLFCGIVCLLLGVLILSIDLSVITRSEERDQEKSARRQERLKAILAKQNQDKAE